MDELDRELERLRNAVELLREVLAMALPHLPAPVCLAVLERIGEATPDMPEAEAQAFAAWAGKTLAGMMEEDKRRREAG